MAIQVIARARRPCCQLFQSPAHLPADSRPAPAPAHVSRPAAVLSRPCHIDQIQTVYNVGVVALPVAGCVPHHRCVSWACKIGCLQRRYFLVLFTSLTRLLKISFCLSDYSSYFVCFFFLFLGILFFAAVAKCAARSKNGKFLFRYFYFFDKGTEKSTKMAFLYAFKC